MKRLVYVSMAVAVFLFLIVPQAYSASKPKYGGRLVVGQDIDAVGIDPQKAFAFASWTHFEQLYNSLLGFDERGNLQPELAVSWTNPDPTTYIFNLRKGVKFHDGSDFDAEDVKATFDRLLDPKTASVRRKYFSALDRVEILDRYTIRFTLKTPFAPFPAYMGFKAYSAILSKDVIESADPNEKVVGTGAFQMAEYRPNNTMILKRNPHYWEKGLPYLDELEFRLIKDPASRVAALRAKRVDYTWLIEPQLTKILLNEKGIDNGMAAPTGRERVYFNCTKPPLDQLKVRQALSSATDRQAIIDLVVMGKAQLTGPLPPAVGNFAYPPQKLPFYDYNLDRAKKLLAEAGYPDGFKIQAKVAATYQIDLNTLQVLQQQWKKIGVEVDIVKQEFGKTLKDMLTANHQCLVLTDIWRCDPSDYVAFKRAISKRTGFTSPELEKLEEQGSTTLDRNKRIAIFQEMEKKITEASPLLYVYARPQRFEFWADYVKGYVTKPSCSRINFKKTWLDK